ncbi:MAG: DUF2518 family protein [Leptolyngbya sp. SIO4C1]|nr:DUF2518 family protein [Leptolyngbya sp. SIO4C1]
MPTPEFFLQATKWMGIATLAIAALAGLAFVFQWGIRFRLVGATGFSAVLTAGLFGLSFEPLSPAAVPGSVPYTTVFDSGAANIVIAVPQSITETELRATLEQAGRNLFKASRIGRPGQSPIIRARTIIHREPGISDLVYLGQAQSTRDASAEQPIQVTVNPQMLAKASAAAAKS